jgi:hypothetical protein
MHKRQADFANEALEVLSLQADLSGFAPLTNQAEPTFAITVAKLK